MNIFSALEGSKLFIIIKSIVVFSIGLGGVRNIALAIISHEIGSIEPSLLFLIYDSRFTKDPFSDY